jgi:flavin reductase (DIM6/NTAB) family NADH-FMN oxidoreductase RutF
MSIDTAETKKARGNLCMPIVLVSASHGGVSNCMTLAWSSPTSFQPPLVNISVGLTRFTHELIMKSGEFAINVLSEDQMDLAVYCGTISGRDVNKFRERSIPIRPGKAVGAPLVNGCAANIECKVRGYLLTGDHTLFVGEILRYEEDVTLNPLIRFRGMFFKPSEPLGVDEHPAIV